MALSGRLKIKSIKEAKNIQGKVVLVRCDFNVAVGGGQVSDDYKIIKTLPTIRYLLAKQAKVVLMTHLGRPKGKKIKKFSLEPIKTRLKDLLGINIKYINECVGDKVKAEIQKMKDGQIILLENLRFFKEEETNNKQFAKGLAKNAAIYVNDAMAASHRRHASVAAIKKYIPAYAGILLEQEVKNLSKVLHPKRPFIVVMGGAKIETKIAAMKALQKKADAILIGGRLIYDFLAADNLSAGRYTAPSKNKKLARGILNKKIILPVDLVCSANKIQADDIKIYALDNLPKNKYQFDIGPLTVHLYSKYIKSASTIIWNGPMGLFENSHYNNGTKAVARLVAVRSRGFAFGIGGGGATITALKEVGMIDDVDWVSTAGGAMLAFLAGEKLPGLKGIVS